MKAPRIIPPTADAEAEVRAVGRAFIDTAVNNLRHRMAAYMVAEPKLGLTPEQARQCAGLHDTPPPAKTATLQDVADALVVSAFATMADGAKPVQPKALGQTKMIGEGGAA